MMELPRVSGSRTGGLTLSSTWQKFASDGSETIDGETQCDL